jgi:predicted amidophosphoribosyltransferase
MRIEAKELDGGVVECEHEVVLECANCGMPVDAVEYKDKVCSDCGEPWQEKRHVAILVTSIPIFGKTL